MFRAAFTVPFTTADVHTVTKATSPQTSSAVPMMCEDGRPYLTDPVTGCKLCVCHLVPEGAHSHLHGAGAAPGTTKSLASLGSAMSSGLEGAAAGFYSPLLRGMPVRAERLAQCLAPAGPPIAFDPAIATHPYGLFRRRIVQSQLNRWQVIINREERGRRGFLQQCLGQAKRAYLDKTRMKTLRYAGLDVNGLGMRKAATRETTGPLKAWLQEHRKNPYPTKAEKIMLAIITKMTLTQVSTWFANARRRLKKESRLYTGRENDNDYQDDDVPDKEDSGDNDTNDIPKHNHDEPSESDEDINVDISDISDSEDAATSCSAIAHNSTTTTITCSSAPCSKASVVSCSSSLAAYPTIPAVHPHFIPLPGPLPVFSLSGFAASRIISSPDVASTSVLQHSSGASTETRTVPGAGCLQASRINHVGSKCTSPTAVVSRPKIWSISEIIHSDTSPPSSGVKSVPASAGIDIRADKELLGHGSHREALPTMSQRLDLVQHRTLEPSEVKMASRQASAFLVPDSRPSWIASPVGLRLFNPSHASNVVNGSDASTECSPDVGTGHVTEDSPQTEALDLQTKREDRGDSTVFP